MKIFIDPGHNYSRYDTGAQGNGLKEQDVTYNVAIELATLLNKSGVETKLSRNKITDNLGYSTNSSLTKRAALANDWKADYFISLHCDASSAQSAKGAHICVYNTNSQAGKLANVIVPYLLELGLEGRSIKVQQRQDLCVLRKTNMPAMLIEMGFITNPDNAKLMKTPKVLAEAIYKGLCEKLEIKQPKKEEVKVEKTNNTQKRPYTYRKEGTTHIIECDPLSLGAYIADAVGNKIDIGNFVNGGYFMMQANGKTFCQHHLVDQGKIISNYPTHGKPVTTLCVFWDGVVQIKKVYDITQEKGLKFAISGASLTDYKSEGFVGAFSDIARSCDRTYIGYRKADNRIVICMRPNTSIARAKQTFDNLKVDAGLTLDAGGSTCMRVAGKWIQKTGRQINSIVMWE